MVGDDFTFSGGEVRERRCISVGGPEGSLLFPEVRGGEGRGDFQ